MLRKVSGRSTRIRSLISTITVIIEVLVGVPGVALAKFLLRLEGPMWADVNFDDDNFDCTSNAFEVNRNHQQYMKTCQSNKNENRSFLSATKSGTGNPPTVPKQRDARSFLIGDFLGMPAELSVYTLSRKRNKNVHPHVMFSALDEDEKKLLKMWNDMDSKRESRDYNASY
jgi:hypothetical protein